MSDPTPIIHIVFEHWINDGQKSAGKTLIEAMFHEVGLPVPENLLHNQWINYYNRKDVSPVYVPSKMYSFKDVKSSVYCNIQHKNSETPECIMWINDPHKDVVNHILSICQDIGRSQKITDLYLRHVSYQHLPDLPDPEVFNMSKTAQSVILDHCVLPHQTLNHLMQQITKSNFILVDGVKEIDDTTVLVESLTVRKTSRDEQSFVLRNCNFTSQMHALNNFLTYTRQWKQIDLDIHNTTMPSNTLNLLIQQISGWNQMYLKDMEQINEEITEVKWNQITVEGMREIDNTTVRVESLTVRFALGDEPSIVLRNCSFTSKMYPVYYLLTHTRQWKQIDIHKLTHSAMTVQALNYLIQKICGSEQMEMKDVEQINDKILKVGEFSFRSLSPDASIKLDHCTIPSQTLNSLIQQNRGWNQIYMKDVEQIDGKIATIDVFSTRLASSNEGSIILDHCTIPPHTLNRLTQEVNQCSTIQHLCLPHTTLTGCLSSFLPESRQVLLELKKLDVQYTALSKKDLRHLLFIVHNLPELRVLNLSGNTLKGCFARFILDPYQGLPHLEELHLESTKVNKRDLQCISKITQSNKLPKLKILDLSHNILTECLSSFLQDPHPGLPELKEINLCDTSLSKKDLQELFHITQSGKLPKLQVLDLSQNILTGYLTCFLPDTNLGLNELERLYLRETSLNKEDLQHLLHITQSNKLPKAQELVLYPVSYNRLFR